MLTISGSGIVFAVVCTRISNAQTIESVVAPRTNLAIAQRDIYSRTNLSPNSANSRNQHNRSHTYVFIALLIPSITFRNGNRLPVYLKPYEKTRPIILLLITWPFPPPGYEHTTWQWRHNERDAISNHRRLDCLPNHLLRYRSKKLSKLHAIGLCEGNPPVTGRFPSQRASNTENVSIWWRDHEHIIWLFWRKNPNNLRHVDAMEIQIYFKISQINSSWIKCD